VIRETVVNTASLAPIKPIGLLLWPQEFTLALVEDDLGVSSRHFRIVRYDVPREWRQVYGRDRSTVVFDPFEVSGFGEFGAILRSRRFDHVIVGLKACRARAAEMLAGALA
jgi:hypothetical protein